MPPVLTGARRIIGLGRLIGVALAGMRRAPQYRSHRPHGLPGHRGRIGHAGPRRVCGVPRPRDDPQRQHQGTLPANPPEETFRRRAQETAPSRRRAHRRSGRRGAMQRTGTFEGELGFCGTRGLGGARGIRVARPILRTLSSGGETMTHAAISALLTLSLMVAAAGPTHAATRLVSFQTMHGVDGPFLGDTEAIRGVSGDDLLGRSPDSSTAD